jgi:hypothetical protein
MSCLSAEISPPRLEKLSKNYWRSPTSRVPVQRLLIAPGLMAVTKKIPETKPPRADGKTRALLDTNVWRYVVDGASQGPFLRLARQGSYDLQIAPAVLYETLRLRDAQLRATLVRLMTNPRFHRLMPEAYSESMEILQEIERVRPDWLRGAPDLHFFNRLKKDWTRTTGGFWVRSTRSPEAEARFLNDLEGEMIVSARSEPSSRMWPTVAY